MNNQELITQVEEICGQRLSSEARESGEWIIWDCNKSGKTMIKFVGRVKTQTGQPAFFRTGRFGVKALAE